MFLLSTDDDGWSILSTFSQQTVEQLEAIQEVVLSDSQPAITCPKLAIETQEEGVKYVQS